MKPMCTFEPTTPKQPSLPYLLQGGPRLCSGPPPPGLPLEGTPLGVMLVGQCLPRGSPAQTGQQRRKGHSFMGRGLHLSTRSGDQMLLSLGSRGLSHRTAFPVDKMTE